MKKVLKLTLAVALTMGATSLFAQKFGRINTQEIIALMPETKAMQENLDTFGKELQDNIETMNVEFNNKLQEFQKNSSTYNDAVREMKAKELQDLQNRSREFQEMSQQQYQQKYNELLTPIIEKAKNAIDKVSAAGGYTAVFDTAAGAMAYFSETLLTDIAPEVRTELGIPADAKPITTPRRPLRFNNSNRIVSRKSDGPHEAVRRFFSPRPLERGNDISGPVTGARRGLRPTKPRSEARPPPQPPSTPRGSMPYLKARFRTSRR